MVRMNAALLGVLVLASCGAGCSSNPTSPTTPTTPTTPTGPTTDTFSSVLTGNGGRTSHAFKASGPGTVSVTLTNLGAPVTVGLGLGIPNANGSGCNLNTTVDATASATAQITSNIDTGTYCVELYDTGKLRADVSFAVRIVHP